MPKPRLNQVPLAIVADDLAGACDCGAEFVTRKPQVDVRMVTRLQSEDGSGRAVEQLSVINTESRDLVPSQAASLVNLVLAELRNAGVRVALKKNDSAFRGNYREELRAAVRAFEPALTVICPAIPDYGRTTIGGVQMINGVPASDGFYADDPKHAAPASRLVEVLPPELGPPILVGLAELRTGRLPPASRRGGRIVVVDGETNADLDRTAATFLPGQNASVVHPDDRVLLVGGQGIAAAIARQLPSVRESGPLLPIPDPDRILLVAGSLAPATREQVLTLKTICGIAPVTLHAQSRQSDRPRGLLIRELRRRAHDDGAALFDTASARNASPEEIEATAAGVCAGFFERDSVSRGALFVTGGSTAYAACSALGIRRFTLRERIATGTVLAEPADTSAPLICVKGGSLGEADTMVRFIRLVSQSGR